MKGRADSASRRSCSAVEPTRSAKTIVTTLRAPAASAGAPTDDAALAPVAVPHSSQDFAVGRSPPPQLAQACLSGAADSSQNLAPARFSCWQPGQVTRRILPVLLQLDGSRRNGERRFDQVGAGRPV